MSGNRVGNKQMKMRNLKMKRFKMWCPGCDCYVLENGKRCPVCGSKWKRKSKNKKYPLNYEPEIAKGFGGGK